MELGLCGGCGLRSDLRVARTGVWKLGCALSLLGGGGGRLNTGEGRLEDGGPGGGGPCWCLFSVDELQICNGSFALLSFNIRHAWGARACNVLLVGPAT